ncbi:Cyclohexadienyl dehydrogenase [subsurface metagenome]
MKELKQITVIGLGLLGGSLTLAVSRCFPRIKTIGFTHRPATRKKARQLAVADKVVDDISDAVSNADLVILATPIYVFEFFLTLQ